MVRPLSVYLLLMATFLLVVGLFLPAGRGLSILQLGTGSATEIGQLQAEEMGCAPENTLTGSTTRPLFIANFESFFSTSGVLCGKSSISMLLTGKYWWANFLLVLPALLAIFTCIKLFFQPFARNHDKNLLLISGLINLLLLVTWWSAWVKFRVYPGIGFWVSLAGSALLLIAGLVAPRIDAFRERHHPHLA